jgi:ABC-type polysaccharide transport system permease subunit
VVAHAAVARGHGQHQQRRQADGQNGVLVFSYPPMFGVVIAFKDYRANKGIWGSEWVGLKNFAFLFGTPAWEHITFNTIYLNLLFIVTGLIGAIGLALLLNEVRLKIATRVYQTVIFFPLYYLLGDRRLLLVCVAQL